MEAWNALHGERAGVLHVHAQGTFSLTTAFMLTTQMTQAV